MKHHLANIVALKTIHCFAVRHSLTKALLRASLSGVLGLLCFTGCDSRQDHAMHTASTSLTKVTREVLQSLNSPAEIRFYALLDKNTVGAETTRFAERAKSLVETYKDASGGKVILTIIDSQSDSNTALAIADGMRAFNLNKGDASFLGLSVRVKEAKETLPLLSPDYEFALEADITRTILRASELSRTAPAALDEESNAATVESVKSVLPNYASIPLEEGAKIIRESMLQDLTKQGQESQTRIAEAQAALERTRQSGSQSEQMAAQSALAQAEKENADRIQEIVAKSTAQIRALEKLKSEAR